MSHCVAQLVGLVVSCARVDNGHRVSTGSVVSVGSGDVAAESTLHVLARYSTARGRIRRGLYGVDTKVV